MADINSMDAQPINRRSFLKIVAAGGLALGLGAASSRRWLEYEAGSKVQETRLLMGTVINLTIYSDDQDQARSAVEATFAEMERLIKILDHRHQHTALGQLNARGSLSDTPRELLDVLGKALEIGELTGGAFDITVKPILEAYAAGERVTGELRELVDFRQVMILGDQVKLGRPGMAVTLDGIAKGRVVDGGVAVLQRMGFDNVLVEAGGDLAAHGSRGDGTAWEVGIFSPRETLQPGTLATIPVMRQAVATSGDYMNAFSTDFSLHHILDPRTLSSPAELSAATVIAPTAMEADALSTALMVLGSRDGLALVERLPQVEALLVGKDLKIHRSAGFPV